MLNWKDWIRKQKEDSKLTMETMANELEVSVTTVKHLLKVPPKQMDLAVKICLLFGVSLESCNRLLWKLGFTRLYARTPAQAIYIYLLARGNCKHPAATYRSYVKAYQTIYDTAQHGRPKDTCRTHREMYEKRQALQQVSTIDELSLILDIAFTANEQHQPVDGERDLIFRKNAVRLFPGFETPYQELYTVIYERLCMASLSRGIVDSLAGDVNISLTDLFGKSFSTRFSSVILAMLREGKAPSRPFLIALGLRLDMMVAEISDLLLKAGYGPLNGKDYFEGVLIGLMEQLEAVTPFCFASHVVWEMPLREVVFPKERRPDGFMQPLFRDVYDYSRMLSREEASIRAVVDPDWEIHAAENAPPEMALDEYGMVPEETIAAYVSRRLQNAGQVFEEDADTARRFIQLLMNE